MGLSDATVESKWFFQFIVLRRLAGDRLGHDARADQVRRLHHLRDRLRRVHLPDRVALGLRRRLAADERRHAGLRRLDRGPHDRRDRRAGGAAAARPAPRQVRRRRQAAGDPRPQHAAVRARRPDPVAGLVRVQPGLDAQRAGRALHRDPARHPARRRGRRDDGGHHRGVEDEVRSTSAWPATARSAALVAITAPSGYVELWTAPIIGGIAGIIVPLSIYAIDKRIDDPVGALSAHGIAGIWGTLSCGLFTAPRLAQYNGFGDPDGGLIYSGAFTQLGYQALGIVVVFTFVFGLSFLTFWLIKKTYGLRVTRRGGRSRAGHLRARHVRVSGAVHPSAGAHRLLPWPPGRATSRRRRPPPRRSPHHEEGRSVHPARGVRADPHGAAGPRLPLALHHGGQGIRAPEGHHRALSRRRADQLPAPEGQDRVRGRLGRRADGRRHDPQARPHRARSATARCSCCPSTRRTGSAPASPARRRCRPTPGAARGRARSRRARWPPPSR